MDVNNIGKSTWLQLPPLLPTARWSILRFRIYTCSNKRGGVYADVPSSTVSCLFCEPPDLKQCNEAIEKLWLLSWRFSQTCSQSTCSGKPLEAVTTHVQNYKTIYIGVGEVPEATAQTRVHARRTRRAGRPEGWTGGTGREKISRELQIMDLISDPRMCCLDASTSFEAFSQNPSLKVPYSPVPPLAIHKNLVLLQLSSTHPSQKKNTKNNHPASHSYFAVALGVPSAILLRNWQIRGSPQGCWDLPIHRTLWETLWEVPPLVPHREEPAGTTRAVSVQMEASKDENLSWGSFESRHQWLVSFEKSVNRISCV